jgi:hypothetical protein
VARRPLHDVRAQGRDHDALARGDAVQLTGEGARDALPLVLGFHDGVHGDEGARGGLEDEVLDVADHFAPGDRLEAATRTVVADLYVAHGQLLAS